MKLEMCKECGSGDTGYGTCHDTVTGDDYLGFYCKACGNTGPAGESREKAAKAWNDLNAPILTAAELKAELKAENEELKADILKTVIQAGEVLKHHTELMTHIEALHLTLADTVTALINQDSHPKVIDAAEAVMLRTPLQSLHLVEACAVRKAATILCMNEAGKTMVSHTALNKYADQLVLG